MKIAKQFLTRICHWWLDKTVVLSEKEREIFDKKYSSPYAAGGTGVTEDDEETLRKIVVWRYTNLQTILFLELIILILQSLKTVDTFDYYADLEEENDLPLSILSSLGTMSIISNKVLALSVLIIGVIVSYYHRYDLSRSSRILRYFFIAFVILKLWPSVFQSDAKLQFDEMLGEDMPADLKTGLRLSFTIKNAIELLPLMVAFPRGATNGAMAVFGSRPHAVTPKIVIIFFYPFATMLLILGASSLAQMAGDWLLACSLTCFFINDVMMYLSYNYVLAGDPKSLSSGWKGKTRLSMKILGVILLVAWILSAFIPCIGLTSENIESITSARCLMLIDVDLDMQAMSTFMFRFLHNWIISKIIFFDVIMLTVARCEPTVSGLFAFIDNGNNDGENTSAGVSEEKAAVVNKKASSSGDVDEESDNNAVFAKVSHEFTAIIPFESKDNVESSGEGRAYHGEHTSAVSEEKAAVVKASSSGDVEESDNNAVFAKVSRELTAALVSSEPKDNVESSVEGRAYHGEHTSAGVSEEKAAAVKASSSSSGDVDESDNNLFVKVSRELTALVSSKPKDNVESSEEGAKKDAMDDESVDWSTIF